MRSLLSSVERCTSWNKLGSRKVTSPQFSIAQAEKSGTAMKSIFGRTYLYLKYVWKKLKIFGVTSLVNSI